MPGYTNAGVKDEDSIYIADWEEIWVTPSGGTKEYLGATDNAVILMLQQYVEALGSMMPRKLIKRVMTQAGMELKADLKEVNEVTMGLVLGQSPNDPGTADAPEGRIIYHGSRKSEVICEVHGTGRYPDGEWAEFHMFGAYAVAEEVPWAGGAQVNTVPLHMRAVHVSGQTELGWIRVPVQV